MIVGDRGPAVILDARTCAWLEAYGGMAKLRLKAAPQPEIHQALAEIRAAAEQWRGSATGTTVAAEPELDPQSSWVSTSQVAVLLRVSPRAVVKAIARGRLPATQVAGRWRIRREDVELYRSTALPERTHHP